MNIGIFGRDKCSGFSALFVPADDEMDGVTGTRP
jgi:hypothetical protein